MKLNQIQQRRWNNALKQFTNIKDMMTKDSSLVLLYHGEPVSADQIEIKSDYIGIHVDNIRYMIFEISTCDHGLYTPIREFNRSIRRDFRLMKEVKW